MEDVHVDLLRNELMFLIKNMELKHSTLLSNLLAKNVLNANHYESLEVSLSLVNFVCVLIIHIVIHQHGWNEQAPISELLFEILHILASSPGGFKIKMVLATTKLSIGL